MNMSQVIVELGRVEAMGTGHLDPLNDVPEVMPVKKLAVSWQLDMSYFSLIDPVTGRVSRDRR